MMSTDMFTCIRKIYHWADENPELIKPAHYSVYIVAVQRCNTLGWKEKFGLPTDVTMRLAGISSRKIYYKTLDDLIQHGFIQKLRNSKNQHECAMVSLGPYSTAKTHVKEQAMPKQALSSVPIIRHIKTDKNFKNNINNREYLVDLIINNRELNQTLSEIFANLWTEKEKISEDFLKQKMATGEHLNWPNEAAFLKHFSNWVHKILTKKNQSGTTLQKAQRR